MKRLEQLDDYATGLMPDALADSFEEEMFAAAARGEDEDDRWYDRFYRLMLYIAQGGVLIRGTTAEDIADLRAHGLRVHVVDMGAGGPCTWNNPKDEVDLIVTHTPIDIRGWDHVDVEVSNPDGKPVHTFKDVLPDPQTGNLYAICAPPLAMMSYGERRRITRVTGLRPGETEREAIAVYDSSPA